MQRIIRNAEAVYRVMLSTNIKNVLLVLALVMLMVVSCIIEVKADVPFIYNYGRDNYGSGNSTWRMASYDRWTFFANEKGLLVYDGVSWVKHPLNNNGETRGVNVFPDKHRIYVGGENEFGYFEVSSLSGDLVYHCLSDSIDDEYKQTGNVWEIYELTNVLCLRCDDHILTIAGDKLSYIKSKEKMFASVLVDGVIYVATDHGVKMVAGERFLPIMNGDMLEGKRINAMFKYGQCMIVTTATDGLFYYDGRTVTPFPTQADELLKKGVVCCAAIRNETVAIGTIQNGLVILDLKTGNYLNYDERHGLQNNTVLSVGFDRDGNVWAGMDYGIDRVMLDAPFSYLCRGTFSLGIGYSAQVMDDKLYLGTDRGLFSTRFSDALQNSFPEIVMADCPSGPAWCLYRHEGELFCLHDKGLFLVNGNTTQKITDIIGAWACQDVKGHPDMLFVGVYSGVYLIKKIDGQWISLGRISGIDESARYFRQTADYQLTIYNRNLGTANVYQLDHSLLKVKSRQPIIARWNDVVNDGILKIFNDWNISGSGLQMDSDRFLVPCSKGFILFNKQKTNHEIEVAIRRMYITSHGDSLVYSSNFCNFRPEPRIAFANNSVRFEYQVQTVEMASINYQYRLNGGAWSTLAMQTSKEYSNLHEGKYTFEVRAILPTGGAVTDSITFYVLPPWYRTWPAYFCYMAIVMCIFYMLFRLESRRIAHKQNLAVAEKNKEVGKLKIEIDQLEKEKLDLELSHKNQEIANLVISVARKNNTLNDLKESIRQVAVRLTKDNTAESKRELLLINNRIDANMEGDEVLHKFEEQFDLVNDNFMKKLSERHPDLSYNERLMCAYLKMSLSTKEIAPLLNISIRGVETMRYRIRKKFGLERDNNLTEYMNSL